MEARLEELRPAAFFFAMAHLVVCALAAGELRLPAVTEAVLTLPAHGQPQACGSSQFGEKAVGEPLAIARHCASLTQLRPHDGSPLQNMQPLKRLQTTIIRKTFGPGMTVLILPLKLQIPAGILEQSTQNSTIHFGPIEV